MATTQQMGLGKLGGSSIIFKRKFRWTFQVTSQCTAIGSIPAYFVKLASRPNISFEETEINFLNAKDWIPGKATWETITVTYYDIASQDMKPLYNWLSSVYNFSSTDQTKYAQMGTKKSDYACTGTLTMFDGSGNPLEEWTLNNMWPQAINFGDLDYSTSEESTIELTLRYSDVQYKSLCPAFTPEGCITGCN